MTAARGHVLFVLLAALSQGCSDVSPELSSAAGKTMRIVTLAPHLAELVHAVGAGDFLVGVSAYSDYPEEVAALPQVGDAFALDQEQLALLHPDLILAWASGTPQRSIDELRNLGYRVEMISTLKLKDIATALRRIGELVGGSAQANYEADYFIESLKALRLKHRGSEPVRVFYQVSLRPLYTVNDEHYASELIDVCGGKNVFADLGDLAPLVSEEAVLARDPEVFVAGSPESVKNDDNLFGPWRRWQDLAANRYDSFFTVDANRLARATPRILGAGRELCGLLQEARRRRDAALTAVD